MEQVQQIMERFGEVEEIEGKGDIVTTVGPGDVTKYNQPCALVTFKSRAAAILESQYS